MAKISFDSLFKRQRQMRYLTIFALLIIVVVFGQMILLQGKKTTLAMGDTQDNPYLIKDTGFIWNDGQQAYYVKTAGNSCNVRFVGASGSGLIVDTDNDGTNGTDGVDKNCFKNPSFGRTDGRYATENNKLTNRHVRIDGNIVVVMWGTSNLQSLTVAGGAILTHAPLVYLTGSGAGHDYEALSYATDMSAQYDPTNSEPDLYTAGYTPGYSMAVNGEQDFDLNTGAISASGLAKKVDINSHTIRILDGQINVVGRGYPGANGNGHLADWGNRPNDLLDRGFTDYYADNDAAAVPVGLPLDFGGYGGFKGGSGTNYGGGGSGFKDIGGRANYVDSSPGNAQIVSDKLLNSRWTFSGNAVTSASTVHHGDPANPTDTANLYGAGGGASGRYDGDVDRGGSGGGTISLNGVNSGSIELHSDSVLDASGQNGIDTTNYSSYGGGAGAGGTILLIGAAKIVNDVSNTNVSGGIVGGKAGSMFEWNNDSVPPEYSEVTDLALDAIVRSSGGVGETDGAGACRSGSACGGGGAGGLVLLYGPITQSCIITASDDPVIPATCENKDVTIDGKSSFILFADGVAVRADAVTVWQADLNPAVAPNLPAGAKVGAACTVPGNALCDSKRHFASLTLINNATLFHDLIDIGGCDDTKRTTNPALGCGSSWTSWTRSGTVNVPTTTWRGTKRPNDMDQDLNGNKSLADQTTGTARWKKVDLEIDRDIVLKDTSKIDVSGQGYPGGDGSPVGDGSGPGGGKGLNLSKDHVGGCGGGYGGSGGGCAGYNSGSGDNIDGGVSYGNPNNPTDFGSGGGGAREANHAIFSSAKPGQRAGAGGGRIFLSAKNISLDSDSEILANGDKGGSVGAEGNTFTADAGGGAGGSILIKVSLDITGTMQSGPANVSGGGSYPTRIGSDGSLIPLGFLGSNVQAFGGDSKRAGGGGGGGRIFLNKNDRTTVTIRKTLKPISRPNLTPANAFNPYALLVNDRIAVDLSLSGLVPGKDTKIEDGLLSTGIVSCKGSVSDVSGNGGGVQSGVMVWLITPADFTEELSYECTIQ